MEIMKTLNYISLCILLVLSGCITDIDFEVPGTVQNAIVIQAKVIKGNPSVVDVQVVNAFDFTGQSPTISVAEAVLENITSGQRLSLPTTNFNARGAMIFDGDPDMSINFTDEYTLTVRSASGGVFTSSPERLFDVPSADSLTYEIVEIETETIKGVKTFDDVLQYKINTSTVNSQNELTRLRWSFSHIYSMTDEPPRFRNTPPKVCYISDNLGAATEVNYNPEELGVSSLSNFDLIQTAITANYTEGSYFQAIQQSLSLGAYEYFREIQELISREGGVFDPPAGQIRTNFQRSEDTASDVFGYFYLASQDTVRVFIEPEDIGVGLPRVCDSTGPNGRALDICNNCLSANNSTTVKPSWWQ